MTEQRPKTRLRPVIRVFVSSTFSDMKHERNALQQAVFPALERLCLRRGFQFQAIDLRWGVSTEAGLDHRTMRICFDELRRAQEISPQPNFLILLGDRYGWRPLPEEMAQEEFQRLEQAAAQITTSGPKTAVAVLKDWYRRDKNADPPGYVLQSRRQQLSDRLDYTDNQHWNGIQVVLWEIMNRAWPPEQLPTRFEEPLPADGSLPAIVRFQTSATEQEIWHGALRVPDACEHVVAFFREIGNLNKFTHAVQLRDFIDVDSSDQRDMEARAAQVLLKKKLQERLGERNVLKTRSTRLRRTHDPFGRSTVDIRDDHLPQFCAKVEKRLTEIIQDQMDQYWNRTSQGSPARTAREMQIEQSEHERFGRERGSEDSFVGRQAELAKILDYIQSDSPWPLVVHGAGGCGKTALLARAVQEAAKARQPLVRFLGVTPRSSDICSLLGSLCQELRLRHPLAEELPTEYGALREELHQHFRAATTGQPLILFLDALDQLSDADGGRLLRWIPLRALSNYVKLVVSCLSDRDADDPAGQPYVELTRRGLPAENLIHLDALSEAEARTLLFDRWLPQAGRTVNEDQQQRIEQRLASVACRQPLYLKLLFEEVRLWRSYDSVPALGDGVAALLGQLFDRLERPENHGSLFVERALGYLAAARRGLAENEILEVLFADPDYKAALDRVNEKNRHELPGNAKRLPIAIWSRLRFDVAPYLTERAAPGSNVLTFYHRQVAEEARRRYLGSNREQVHRRLADHFERQQYDLERLEDPHSGVNRLPTMPSAGILRKADELPWQLQELGDWDRLQAALADLPTFVALRRAARWELHGYWSKLKPAFDPNEVYPTVVADYERVHGSSLEFAVALVSLGHFFGNWGNIRQEEIMYRRALEIREALLGWDDADTLESATFVAVFLEEKGDFAAAEVLNRRVYETRKRTLGDEHPATLRSLNNLAVVCGKLGDHTASEKWRRQAFEGFQRILGPKHDLTLRTGANLALALERRGKFEEAEMLLRRAAEIGERIRGPDDLETLSSQETLAGFLSRRGKAAEAESLLRGILLRRGKILGPTYTDTIHTLNNLALALGYQGKHYESRLQCQESWRRCQQALAKSNPHTISVMIELGDVLLRFNEFPFAAEVYQRALQACREAHGPEHGQTLYVALSLATTMVHLGRFVKAEKMYVDALRLAVRHLGSDDPITRDLFSGLQAVHARCPLLALKHRLRRLFGW